MARTICGLSPGVFLALLIFLVARALFQLNAFRDVSKLPSFQRDPRQCRSLAGTAQTHPSCEDFKFVSEDIIVTGVGNIMNFVHHGQDSPGSTALLAIDLRTEAKKELPVNIPGIKVFRPHGVEVFKDRLFVVNHAENFQERVEVFELTVRDNNLDTVSIKWLDSIQPPVPKGSLNSVTAVSENEIYVTHFFPHDMPLKGMEGPVGFNETLSSLSFVLSLLGSKAFTLSPAVFGRTHAYRCLLDSKECTKATARFSSANGITSSKDGKFVFVGDCIRQIIVVYERNSLGKLFQKLVIHTPYDIDNIMLATPQPADGKIEIWAGTMPETLHYSLAKDNLRGGLLTIVYDPEKNAAELKDVFIHDGSLTSGVATAAQWRNKVILSGPKEKGALTICDLQ